MKNLLTSIALMLFITVTAQHNLELNLEKGATYYQNLETAVVQKQQVMGMDQNITSNMTLQLRYVVTDIKDGIYSMDLFYDRMKTDMDAGMMAITMDSDGDPNDEMNKILKVMTGVAIPLTMTKKGKVLTIDTSSLIDNMKDMDPASLEQMKQSVGSDKLKKTLDQYSIAYPQGEVSIGDSWDSSTQIDQNFPGTATYTMTLDKKEGDSFMVSGSGIIKTDKDNVMVTNGYNSKMDLSGPSTVSITIDATTGWVTAATINADLKGAMTLLAGGQIPQDTEVKMDMKIESIIK